MSGVSLDGTGMAELARRLLGEPNRRLSTRRELRFGHGGSLAVIPERGVWYDHEAGVGGGVLDLPVHVGAARTQVDAARLLEGDGLVEASSLTGRWPEPSRTQAREAEALREKECKRTVAAALWRAGGPLTGTAGDAYLRTARRVTGPLDGAELRFLLPTPLTPYRPDGRTAPALVARVANVGGRLIGAHLTFLRPDGSGKADLPAPRKMVGAMSGGAVTLRPGPGGEAGGALVAEGLESALSAADALDAAHGASSARLAVVAGLCAHGLSTLPLRADWRELVIAPDHDASGTGERASLRLAERAWAAGLAVRFMPPPDGCGDWNDAARRAQIGSGGDTS